MKILELATYSAGICGVGNRVKEESKRLIKLGHEVRFFSTNIEKGTNKIAPEKELMEGVLIQRFPAKKLGGESYTSWNFEDAAIAYKPDVIIAHAYRHTHTTRALSVGKKIGAKVFLVTHAPCV